MERTVMMGASTHCRISQLRGRGVVFDARLEG